MGNLIRIPKKWLAKRLMPKVHTPWGLSPVAPRKEKGPAKTFDTSSTFVEALGKKGYKYLGSGAYSTVMGKEGSDKVLKILRQPDDDGWLPYVKWASVNGYAGNFAPKVYSYKYIKGRGENFALASMERLEDTKLHGLKVVANLADNSTCNDDQTAKKALDVVTPGLSDFMAHLIKEFPVKESHIDLHGGNFMARKNGSIVVVDPVATPPKVNRRRLKAGDFSPALAA